MVLLYPRSNERPIDEPRRTVHLAAHYIFCSVLSYGGRNCLCLSGLPVPVFIQRAFRRHADAEKLDLAGVSLESD